MALTSRQLQQLEKRLHEERERALSALNRIVSENSGESEQGQTGDLTKLPLHMADRGTDTMQDELDASNETRISRELAEIDAALERMYETPEKFGVSEATGEPIAFERLDIIPWART